MRKGALQQRVMVSLLRIIQDMFTFEIGWKLMVTILGCGFFALLWRTLPAKYEAKESRTSTAAETSQQQVLHMTPDQLVSFNKGEKAKGNKDLFDPET